MDVYNPGHILIQTQRVAWEHIYIFHFTFKRQISFVEYFIFHLHCMCILCPYASCCLLINMKKKINTSMSHLLLLADACERTALQCTVRWHTVSHETNHVHMCIRKQFMHTQLVQNPYCCTFRPAVAPWGIVHLHNNCTHKKWSN